jgi:hypothetical protein
MFSLLTGRGLWIALAILTLTVTAEAAYISRLLKQQGAAAAECEVTKLEDSSKRNDLVINLQADALRFRNAQLEEDLKRSHASAKLLAQRERENAEIAEQYMELLYDARKQNTDLDAPLDDATRERLRWLEESYRTRTQGSSSLRSRRSIRASPG